MNVVLFRKLTYTLALCCGLILSIAGFLWAFCRSILASPWFLNPLWPNVSCRHTSKACLPSVRKILWIPKRPTHFGTIFCGCHWPCAEIWGNHGRNVNIRNLHHCWTSMAIAAEIGKPWQSSTVSQSNGQRDLFVFFLWWQNTLSWPFHSLYSSQH